MLRYSIDGNFAQARSERPRFDSPVIWGGMGYGSAVETLALPLGDPAIRRPGFDSCRGLVKNKNIGCSSPVVIALALTLEVGGSIPRNPVLIFFLLQGIIINNKYTSPCCRWIGSAAATRPTLFKDEAGTEPRPCGR